MVINLYCVYKHTAPNGKVYIGITSKNPCERWQNGHGYKSNIHFWNAIVKYGWDNFEHEIIFDGLTKEEACQKEIELIAEYKSNELNYGYNQSCGGECSTFGCKWTDEHKRKTSNSLKGHIVSETTRNKIRQARFQQKNLNLVGAKKGKNNPRAKRIIVFDNNGTIINVFETIKDASTFYGVCHQSISDCCRGKLKTVKGYIFAYG